jgi:hypothetical protein
MMQPGSLSLQDGSSCGSGCCATCAACMQVQPVRQQVRTFMCVVQHMSLSSVSATPAHDPVAHATVGHKSVAHAVVACMSDVSRAPPSCKGGNACVSHQISCQQQDYVQLHVFLAASIVQQEAMWGRGSAVSRPQQVFIRVQMPVCQQRGGRFPTPACACFRVSSQRRNYVVSYSRFGVGSNVSPQRCFCTTYAVPACNVECFSWRALPDGLSMAAMLRQMHPSNWAHDTAGHMLETIQWFNRHVACHG